VSAFWKRLTTPRAEKRRLILALLDTQTYLSGLELIQRSDGLLSTGSVYPLLMQLEQQGLVEHYRIHAGRHVYRRIETRVTDGGEGDK
jgi:DNA-binding PadR family transcriptional regulator